MWGRATLATEVSSTSMKVPSITEIAMRTGLERGRHSAVASAADVVGGGCSSAMRLTGTVPTAIIVANPMTDLDQEGISGRLRARFTTYQEGPPRRRYAVLGIALVVLVAIGYGVYTWYYWRHHISTDDAYVTAHIAPMSARVPGIVIEVAVNDNQDVKPDQVLVRLDPRDYEVAVAQARAAVVSAKGDLQNAVVSVPLTDDSTKSLVQQADAALGAT